MASLDGSMLMELAPGIAKKLKVTDFPQICFLTTLLLKQGHVTVKGSQFLHFLFIYCFDQFRPSLNSAS